MNSLKENILNPEEDCERYLTCVEEHHLIVDGVASQEMVEFYESVGSKCSPCNRHFEELLSLKLLVQNNVKYKEPSEDLRSKIIQSIFSSY